MNNDLPSRGVDLNAAISEIEKLLRHVTAERATLRTKLDPKLGRVQADPQKIHWLLVNLTVNAHDAMPVGGELLVTTEHVQISSATAGAAQLAPGPYALVDFTVSTGALEPRAAVREIVEQAKGTVSVNQNGATVSIYLPCVGHVVPSKPKCPKSAPRAVGLTILLVEDETVVRESIRRILREGGYQVLEAVNGKQAEGILDTFNVDLMITDIVMPEQDGLETIKSVRKSHPDLKIIAMSSMPAGYQLHAAKLLGAFAVMDKPLLPDVLLDAVRGAIGRPPQ